MADSREYETVCVLSPNLQGDELKKVEDKIKKIFTTHKVKEINKKDWGNRKLAYHIKTHKTGHYVQYVYQAPSAVVFDLEKNLGYEEAVLRYLTVKYDKHTKKDVDVEPYGFEVSDY